jgi:hypothetical protein
MSTLATVVAPQWIDQKIRNLHSGHTGTEAAAQCSRPLPRVATAPEFLVRKVAHLTATPDEKHLARRVAKLTNTLENKQAVGQYLARLPISSRSTDDSDAVFSETERNWYRGRLALLLRLRAASRERRETERLLLEKPEDSAAIVFASLLSEQREAFLRRRSQDTATQLLGSPALLLEGAADVLAEQQQRAEEEVREASTVDDDLRALIRASQAARGRALVAGLVEPGEGETLTEASLEVSAYRGRDEPSAAEAALTDALGTTRTALALAASLYPHDQPEEAEKA